MFDKKFYFSHIAFFTLILLFFMFLLSGCGEEENSSAITIPERTGRIEIILVDGSDNPVSEARIILQSPEEEYFTDADGRIFTRLLEWGTYSFQVSKENYPDMTSDVILEETEKQVTLYYPEKGNLECSFVYSSDLTPAAGIDITITSLASTITTDAEGKIFIEHLEQGIYEVLLSNQDYFPGELLLTVINGETTQKEVYLVSRDKFGSDVVYVQGGGFEMGDRTWEYQEDERPVHTVVVDDFYLSKYEVTNAQFALFLNEKGNMTNEGELRLDREAQIENNSGYYSAKAEYENRPVVYVTWYGARDYCEWAGGRLPTEAEWEHAARGGVYDRECRYSGSDNYDEVGWCEYNSITSSNPVGQKAPNELSLFDMSGNVSEWCGDWYEAYTEEFAINPAGPGNGDRKIHRGGAWDSHPLFMRPANRDVKEPVPGWSTIGFRVAFSKVN